MSKNDRFALGLDFGTTSVRALLVDLKGNEHGSSVVKYRHGQLTETLPGGKEILPVDFALQHPRDWIESSARAARRTPEGGGRWPAGSRHRCGFHQLHHAADFCDGTPLCLLPEYALQEYAWPKLWKHHGAKSQTERINRVQRADRKEAWLARYGGTIGLEWFFPKILEALEAAPQVYAAAEVWLEAGDWYVWRLVGGDAAELPPRPVRRVTRPCEPGRRLSLG